MTVNLFDETGKAAPYIQDVITNTAKMAATFMQDLKNASVDILIVDSAGMREINREKRGIDSDTDVLSFPMVDFAKGNMPAGGNLFLGDIVLCYEKIFQQAGAYGHSARREAGFLTAHGILHLLGYDHMSPEDEKEMFQVQELVLDKMGLKR